MPETGKVLRTEAKMSLNGQKYRLEAEAEAEAGGESFRVPPEVEDLVMHSEREADSPTSRTFVDSAMRKS